MSRTTSPVRSAAGTAARTSTTIEVLADHGRVRVRHAATSTDSAPRIRPVVLSATADHARISLVPEGALLLAGDDVHLQVRVGAHTRLELVEPAGTVAYDMRGAMARWRVQATVAQGSALVWHGEPFVIAEGGRVVREMHAVVAADATLAVRETLVLGRHGERAGELHQATRIERPDGTPVLVDGLDVARGNPGLGLGDRRIVETVMLVGRTLAGTPSAGTLLELEGGGVVWRSLADEAHHAEQLAVWHDAVRESLS